MFVNKVQKNHKEVIIIFDISKYIIKVQNSVITVVVYSIKPKIYA